MAVNECIPYYEPGTRIPASVLAEKAVTGKRFVKIAGDVQGSGLLEGLQDSVAGGNIQIEHAGANEETPLGVASHDAAAGDKVTVLCSPMVVPVTAGEAIAAGDKVGIGANGVAMKAVAASEAEIKEGKDPWKVPPVGLAVGKAAKDADVPVKLFI